MDLQTQDEHSLPFENKYSYEHSLTYYRRHHATWLRRLSTWLERRMLSKALQMAGSPKTVLDLPCGAGRFLPTIVAAGATKVIAADLSEGMLQVAREFGASHVLSHVEFMQANAAKIDLPDKSMDSICCMRLLHHIGVEEYRYAIYKELARVARTTLCVSTWVDGNYKNYRTMKKAKRNTKSVVDTNRHYFDAKRQEQEFINAGFKIIGHVDMLKYYMPWRIYVLAV